MVVIYTDGACIGNPGPGGYGALLLAERYRKELGVGFRWTTNNRMEILAVIAGLEELKELGEWMELGEVIVYSDSRYVVDAVNKGWARRWKANGWRKSSTAKALNPDLWERLLNLLDTHDVTFKWVPGHSGDTGNSIADALAREAAKGKDLEVDRVYEALPRASYEFRRQRRG